MSREMGFMLGFLLALLAGVGFAIYKIDQEHDAWVDWCHSQGGYVTDNTSLVATGNTKNPVSFTTTYYCLTTDGRVLDVG